MSALAWVTTLNGTSHEQTSGRLSPAQPLLERLTKTREQYDIGIVVARAGDGEFFAIP